MIGAVARIRGLGDRRKVAGYSHFRASVEPELNARGRAVSFAKVPVLADDRQAVAVSLAVVQGPSRQGATSGRSHASLERQTSAPLEVLDSLPPRQRNSWLVLAPPGAVLADTALERLGQAIAMCEAARVVTCDDDRLDRSGRRADPRLRPGPSPDLWLERKPRFGLVAVQGAVAELEDPRRRDAALLAHAGGSGEYHVHVPQILCHRASGNDRQAPTSPPRAPELVTEPSVEIVICFRDRPDLLQRAVISVLEDSTYDRLTLRLVDNASTDGAVPELLDHLDANPRVTVNRDPRPFNFSALNNAAAARSDADVLVFLNNDTEVISPRWIEELLAEAMRPEVGAVAPMLLYPGGRVQHAGVAIGIHGWAGHPFAGLKPDERTPFGAASDGTRNWMAVTAACMMVEKRKFDEAGGFDESFAVGGGDVDLCLRLTAAGHRSLCVPRVRLIHDESASRDPGRVPPGDFEASRRSYGAFRTVGDPFYHPALTLQDTSCRLRTAGEPGPPP